MHHRHLRRHPLPFHHRREPIAWGHQSPTVRRACTVHDWYFDWQLRCESCSRCGQTKGVE